MDIGAMSINLSQAKLGQQNKSFSNEKRLWIHHNKNANMINEMMNTNTKSYGKIGYTSFGK